MRKIFTLIAAVAMSFAAYAQDNIFKSSGEAVAAGTVLVDNDNLSVTTVFDAKGGARELSICGVEFNGYFQLRVASDPTADLLTGEDNGSSTPLVVVAKKNVTVTFYDRRQKGNSDTPNANGYNAGDNKGILAINQADLSKVAGSIVFGDYDGEPDAYGLCAESFEFAPGTYTVYRRGSTMQIYGFAWTVSGATEPTEPETPGALMSWDFTKWSDATVANLKAGANWSDIEKADATEPTEKSKDNCFWQVSFEEGKTAEGYLTANDVVIEELKGLVYTNEKSNRSLAIAVNYPDADPAKDFGPYHGPAYLWLGSKEVNYFIIPNVPAGATIKMGVESHKITDARGVTLTVGTDELLSPSGAPVEAPTVYAEQEWAVPATAAALNDVQITNTNGCHIYFITVSDPNTSAIQTIVADENAPVEYFNLQGIRVENPAHGIFIKRQGNKVTKVVK